MKFSDKLSKLRKENNLSQEQFAEKLGVSRQAVSKWESGLSYPDMEKILSMCSILNCKLDELLDDGVLGEVKEIKEDKIDFKVYLNNFLKFLTSVINMFSVMSFKQKVKLVFEQLFNAGFLIVVDAAILIFVQFILYETFSFLNSSILFRNFLNLIISLVTILLAVLSAFIMFHLFKVRYLDYYVTVIDKNVVEKTIEEPVGPNNEGRLPKVIIRDPSHSSNRFFNWLSRFLVFTFKCLVFVIAVPLLMLFVFDVASIVVSIYHSPYHGIFLFLTFALVGVALDLYVIIEFLYRFIFNLAQSLKRLFYIGITGLVIMGLGAGLSFAKFLTIDIVKDPNLNKKVSYYEFNDKLVFDNNYRLQYEYVENESLDNVKVTIIENSGTLIDIKKENDVYVFERTTLNDQSKYKEAMSNLKQNKIADNETFPTVIIEANKKNLDILKDNLNSIKKTN